MIAEALTELGQNIVASPLTPGTILALWLWKIENRLTRIEGKLFK